MSRLTKKVRRFEVWARCNHAGPGAGTLLLELPGDLTDEECQAACSDACDTLIANNFDTGWDEISPPDSREGKP